MFASRQAVRHSLNGVNIEIFNSNMRIIGCDGTIIGVFGISAYNNDDINITIPIEAIDNIKLKNGVAAVSITIQESEQKTSTFNRYITLDYNNEQFTTFELTGYYPNYRIVFPHGAVSGESAQFDPNYINLISKAYKILNPKDKITAPHIGYNGKDAALINLNHENFIGALMPLNERVMFKDRKINHCTPDWINN